MASDSPTRLLETWFKLAVWFNLGLTLLLASPVSAQHLNDFSTLMEAPVANQANREIRRNARPFPKAPADKGDSIINLVNKKARRHALQSAVVPGLGQIQNGQIWKAPLVWGGLGLTTYFIIRNNNRFQEFAKAFRKRTDNDSTTVDKFDPEDPDNEPPFSSERALRDGRETFRRNRTLSIIATAAVYLANVIDAYVFAHLQDFNVSDDLSMKVHPPRFANIAQQPGIMAGFTLKLRP